MTIKKRTALSASITTVALCLAGAMPRPALAADFTIDAPSRPTVQVHGFVSPGFLLTTDNNYLAKSKRGSFEFTEVGINFTMPITEKLRAGVQLFAHDLGRIGDYKPRADWYYLDYRFEDWFGLRAGRVKVPFGLYNDTSDIDAARVPVLLPQSVYPAQNRDFLLAQTGVEAYGRVDMRALGALDYRFYGGTIFLDVAGQSTVTGQVVDLDIPFVIGQRLLWETPLEGLRIGPTLQALQLDAVFLRPGQAQPVSLKIPAVLWVASAEYTFQNLLLAAEYSRWKVRLEVDDPALMPPVPVTVSERMYGMASYRINKWFQPGAYYSLYYPNVDRRDAGRAAVQHDLAATLRFDINDNWLVKLEGHFMSGTAALNASLNDGRPPATLERDWGLFLVKTTAHF